MGSSEAFIPLRIHVNIKVNDSNMHTVTANLDNKWFGKRSTLISLKTEDLK